MRKTYSTNSGRLLTDNTLTQTWEDRMKLWLRRYEDIFGITKLSEMHSKVTEVQRQMDDVQEKRRRVQQDILSVQSKLQEVQAKLEKTSRGDDVFISIVTQEHELLKEQKRLSALLEVYDRTEREKHAALAIAISNSQDHERTYREKTKYLSLITGVVGGLIGVLGSSINNWRHRKDIKLFSKEIHDLIQSQNNVIAQKSFAPENSQQQHLTAEISSVNLENLSSEMSELIKTMNEQFENTVDTTIKSHMYTTFAAVYGTLAIVSMLFYVFSSR